MISDPDNDYDKELEELEQQAQGSFSVKSSEFFSKDKKQKRSKALKKNLEENQDADNSTSKSD